MLLDVEESGDEDDSNDDLDHEGDQENEEVLSSNDICYIVKTCQ